jgi:hypothetical protein
MSATVPIRNSELLTQAIELDETPDANRLYMKIIKRAIDVNNHARELEEEKRALAIDVSAWSRRATRAESRVIRLTVVAVVLAISLVASTVILTVVMAA